MSYDIFLKEIEFKKIFNVIYVIYVYLFELWWNIFNIIHENISN